MAEKIQAEQNIETEKLSEMIGSILTEKYDNLPGAILFPRGDIHDKERKGSPTKKEYEAADSFFEKNNIINVLRLDGIDVDSIDVDVQLEGESSPFDYEGVSITIKKEGKEIYYKVFQIPTPR